MKKHKLLSLCIVTLLLLTLVGTAMAAEETYTITYHPTGGTNAPAPQEKQHGVDITLSTQIPVREGYTFLGWASWSGGDVIFAPGDVCTSNYSRSLYAVWKSELTISMGQTIEGIIPAGSTIGYTFVPETDGWYGFAYTGKISKWSVYVQTDDSIDLYYEEEGMYGLPMTAGIPYTFSVNHTDIQDEPFTLEIVPLSGPTGVELTLNGRVAGDTASQIVGYELDFEAKLVPLGYYGGTYTMTNSAPAVGELTDSWYGYTFEALTPGTTVVTVTTDSGLTDSCAVNVIENPVASISAELRTKLYEGLDGYESYGGGFYYEFPKNFLYVTLHYTDGTSREFSYTELTGSGYPVILTGTDDIVPGTNYVGIEYLGASTEFVVEVVKPAHKDLPATQVKPVTEGLDFQRIGGDDLRFGQIGSKASNSKVLLFSAYTVDDNWNYSYSLVATANNKDFTITPLHEVLNKLGIQTSASGCSVTTITSLADTLFVSYEYAQGTGLLRTTDGVTFEKINFPYNAMEIYEIVEAHYYPAKYIYLTGDTYVVLCSQYHYYTSPDLINWTKRDFPSYDWKYETDAVPAFSVAAATDKGLYLKASYNFGPTTDYDEEGIFFTSDFENYKCITESFPDGTLYYTQPMANALQGDRIAIVTVLGDYQHTYYGYHNIRVDIYDENTGAMKNIVNTDSFITTFNFNLGGYDPVQLMTKEQSQNISYYISSEKGEVIASYDLPMDVSTWDASIKSRWQSENGRYYADIALYGDTLYISGDYYKTVHEIKLPQHIVDANIASILTDADSGTLLLLGDGAYVCDLSAIEALLEPAPVLTEENTGVSVIPVSPDAVPAGAAIVAEIVGQDAQTVAYEISIAVEGNPVQPDFPVYVKLPIPIAGEQYSYAVYRIEADGSRTDMDAFVEDGYLWFITDHFSRYELKVSGGTINPFDDVKRGDQFEQAILWAYYNNITKGTSATMFSPENPCTRKQIVTFLWRAAGEPEPESMENPFTDVKHDQFEKAILWAYYEGITKGTSTTEFSPENTCTRKQIVTFLWRYNGSPEPESMENPFGDVKRGDQFEKAILWAYYKGITKGTSDTAFSPENPCTRKQIVTFLYRNIAQ